MLSDLGRELRQARVDRGLSLADVGRAVGLSEASVSRIERAQFTNVSMLRLAQLHAVVGLDLSSKAYPGGQPVRDAAHLALLSAFRARLHRSLGWAVEVPLALTGDQRAWDAVVTGHGWRYGVEAETAPRDGQALVRRLQLKRRDGQVDGVILLVRDTRQTRRFLREVGGLFNELFPVPGDRILELLRAAVDPGGGAIVMLPGSGSGA